jgi:hypothetical protein
MLEGSRALDSRRAWREEHGTMSAAWKVRLILQPIAGLENPMTTQKRKKPAVTVRLTPMFTSPVP